MDLPREIMVKAAEKRIHAIHRQDEFADDHEELTVEQLS